METTRLQIDLSEEKITELEQLMKVCDISTKKDLVNNALSLFAWIIQETQNGKTIASIDEINNRYKELNMPLLDTIRRKYGKQQSTETKQAGTDSSKE